MTCRPGGIEPGATPGVVLCRTATLTGPDAAVSVALVAVALSYGVTPGPSNMTYRYGPVCVPSGMPTRGPFSTATCASGQPVVPAAG